MTQEPALRDDTLDLLFEYVRGQTAVQVGWSEQLDSKGMQFFAAASAVMGLGGLGVGHTDTVTVALIIAGLLYAASAVIAFLML